MKFVIVVPVMLVWLAIGPGLTSADEIKPNYVGSDTCRPCHTDAYEDWEDSHHAKAWTLPSKDTVAGDFNNTRFDHAGRTTRFFIENGRYFIETTDVPDGPKQLEVKGVGGVTPLQQYLIETEPGRLQSLDVAWDVENSRWYHLYPDQKLPPEDGYHWTGPYKNWNARCAECHATSYKKNYDPQVRTYKSRQAEIGVGCEACHGPAEGHLAWARSEEAQSQPRFSGVNETGLLLSFTDQLAATEIEQCAGCHARREPFQDGNPLPGTQFHDAYRLALLRDGLYHPDGQILDEVYVYGSFLQSKMYQQGVRCSDCHEPHSARLKAKGNGLCTQCHSPAGSPRFPSLTQKDYDTPDHHFHDPSNTGADCKSCHMIERDYMGIDGRRDHSFRIPRPDLSAKLGTPNACTDCHSDQPASWAAGIIAKRFPNSQARQPHFSEIFAASGTAQPGEPDGLVNIAKHSAFPGIVRATALDLLWRRASQGQIDTLYTLIDDPDPLVRAATVTLLARRPGGQTFSRLAKALHDPVKAVRIAAARALVAVPTASASQEEVSALRSANRAWQASLSAKLDFPETHMVVGGTALAFRNDQAALRAFQEATSLDPQLTEAWVMQIQIHLSRQDLSSAERTLHRALGILPEHPALLSLRQHLEAR